MRVGEYELTRKIGAGGMGEVWLARRAATDGFSKTVAVKFPPGHLAAAPRARRDFVREVQLSMHLSHSNIVQVFDVGEADGRLFMVMEWVDGCDVRRLLGEANAPYRAVSVPVAAHITGELLRALEYAHSLRHEGSELGIVHRDVSPHNVLISTSGEVKLTDFGVARTEHEETSGRHVPGKLRYMAPEQFKGVRRSRAMDLYAVGAILHELLSGERFRDAEEEGDLYRLILEGVVPELSREDVPVSLEALRRSLLAPAPAGRPCSASEALRFLEDSESPAQARRELAVLCRERTGVEAPRSGVFAALAAEGVADGVSQEAVDTDTSGPETRTLARSGAAPATPRSGAPELSMDRHVAWRSWARRGVLVMGALAAAGVGILWFTMGSATAPAVTTPVGSEDVSVTDSDEEGVPWTAALAPASSTAVDPLGKTEDSLTVAPFMASVPAASSPATSPGAASREVTNHAVSRARVEHRAKSQPSPAIAGTARVTFRASEYDFAYVRVNNRVITLEPRATIDLPAGRHAVFMRERRSEAWRRIGAVRLSRDRDYNVRLRAPGRLDLQLTARK